MTMTLVSVTLAFDLPSGGRLEIDVDALVRWIRATGNNWTEPCVPGHFEWYEFRVESASWTHPNGEWTEFNFQPGSFGSVWLGDFAERREALTGVLTNAVMAQARDGLP